MSEFDLVIAVAYYAFLVFGSVTLGYAFLRLTQPEIRASPRRRKLLLSLAVGAAFALVGIGVDYASYGEDRVLSANGLAPSFLFAAAVICLLVFKAASAVKLFLASNRTMEVAVAAPLEKEGALRLLPFVQEVRRRGASQLKPAAETFSAAATVGETAGAGVEAGVEEKQFGEIKEVPLMEDIWTNKKIGGAEEYSSREKREPKREPTAPPWVKQELPPRQSTSPGGRSVRDSSVRDKLSELKSKSVIEEMKPPSEGGEKEGEENAAAAKEEPAAAPIETPKLETAKIELPELQLPKPSPIQELTPQAAAPQTTAQAEEKSVSSAAAKVFGTPRYAKKEAEKTEIKEKTEMGKTEAGEKKGFLQKIFGGGSASSGSGNAAARKSPSPGATTVRLPPAPDARGGKGDEQEIEVILSELHLVAPPTPSAAKGAKRFGLPKPGAGGRAAAGAAAQESGSGQRHRLYLERRGGAGGGGQRDFSREQAEKQELNDLFSDVYAQVEKPGRPGAARAAAQRGAAVRAAAGGAGGASGAGAVGAGAEKALSVSDLFGSDFKPVKETGSLGGAGAGFDAGGAGASGGSSGSSASSVFAQLDNLDASGKAKAAQPSAAGAEAQAPHVQTVKMQVGRQAGCPHCGAKNVRIIFCPYCSTGMCANCTPNLKPSADAFVYTCPKCGEEVPVARAKKA